MNFRDYIEETKENAKEYMKEEFEEFEGKDGDEILDMLFIEDAVTGNASGSFTFNTEEAQENISELIFDSDFLDDLEFNFGEDIGELIKNGAESVDVTARCLALYHIDFDELLTEIEEERG